MPFDAAVPSRLVAAKGDLVVTVCLPARDEVATIGPIVQAITDDLVGVGLVDEVLVVDDHSTDDTGRVAAAAGAKVVHAQEVLSDLAPGPGKGEALWRGVHAASGDIVVFCDADLIGFDTFFVTRLLAPLLTDPKVSFVKGFYDRSVQGDDGGGRVTELLARPLLATLFPHLTDIVQPLSGEFAASRPLLRSLPFVGGYGVDLALLIDAVAAVGPRGLAQVDLGRKRHRHRSLSDLGVQATAVLQAALSHAGVPFEDVATLQQPGQPARVHRHRELPPLDTLDLVGRRRAVS